MSSKIEVNVEQFEAELSALEARGPVTMQVRPHVIFTLIGTCQVTLKHPEIAGSEVGLQVRAIAQTLTNLFPREAVQMRMAIAQGWRTGS
jgi:hypothetical protein